MRRPVLETSRLTPQRNPKTSHKPHAARSPPTTALLVRLTRMSLWAYPGSVADSCLDSNLDTHFWIQTWTLTSAQFVQTWTLTSRFKFGHSLRGIRTRTTVESQTWTLTSTKASDRGTPNFGPEHGSDLDTHLIETTRRQTEFGRLSLDTHLTELVTELGHSPRGVACFLRRTRRGVRIATPPGIERCALAKASGALRIASRHGCYCLP